MRRLILFIITAALLFATGCRTLQETTVPGNLLTFDFDFAEDSHGWTGDFTDLPVDYGETLYQLEFAHVEKPESLNSSGKALMLSGRNASDDLFMYIKKQLTAADGIKPDTTYSIQFTVDVATNAPAGAVGIGGPPGEAVWVKVGAAPVEPVPVAEENGLHSQWLLNVDKGNQNDDGRNALRIGDVSKVVSDDFETYEIKRLDNMDQPLRMTSDSTGNLWIFVGTDSGFEGATTLYYTSISVTIKADY
ncbi:MAG: hypothetical protein SCM11_09075 [Bacillota bacterium]|nr:hypothetical protein [Bacillota bacterium]